jgi:hypothetical protein
VPHRPVPASFDVALSHPGARSVDALRLDVGDHAPPGNKAAAHPPEPGPATTVTFNSILLKLGASTVTVYGHGNRRLKTKPPSEPDNYLRVSPVAVIVTATLAFITTAPVASLTVPTMSDVVIWPNACCPARKQTLKPLTLNAA